MENPFGYPSLSPERRKAFLLVMSDCPTVAPLLFHLQEHFPPDKLDAALGFLRRNKITGPHFERLYRERCGGSLLELQKFLLTKTQRKKSNDGSPLIFGRDFF